MKRLGGVLVLGYALLMATAQAAAFTNGPITLELPNGWSAEYVQDANLTGIQSAKNDYVITFTVMPAKGVNVKEMAQHMAKEANGATPKLVNGMMDAYVSKAIIDGEAGLLTVAGTDNGVLIVTEMGNFSAYGNEKRALWNSLGSFDSATKTVLDGLVKYHTLGTITICVPPGWNAEKDTDAGVIGASSPDGKCSAGLLVRDTGSTPGPEAAASLSKLFNGTTPKKDGDDDTFHSFECILDGKETTFTVATNYGKTMAFYETGDVDDYWNEVNRIIWNSLDSSDADEKALFDGLNKFEE